MNDHKFASSLPLPTYAASFVVTAGRSASGLRLALGPRRSELEPGPPPTRAVARVVILAGRTSPVIQRTRDTDAGPVRRRNQKRQYVELHALVRAPCKPEAIGTRGASDAPVLARECEVGLPHARVRPRGRFALEADRLFCSRRLLKSNSALAQGQKLGDEAREVPAEVGVGGQISWRTPATRRVPLGIHYAHCRNLFAFQLPVIKRDGRSMRS